ncbi:MAG: DUF1080 domain-containing protein [Planctomycetota bacterium]
MTRRLKSISFVALLGAVALVSFTAWAQEQEPERKLGYQDTPIIPGSEWHVHDGERPQPRIVTPGSASTQDAVGRVPSDAIILFNGKDTSQWTGRGGEAKWKVENGYMEVNGTGDIQTKDQFGSCQLHLEWMTPPPKGDGQGRGNSGVFFFGRYEIQILDSYENQTYPDGQAGAIYGQLPPMVNASRPPGQWQTYDIIFEAPTFANGEVTKPAEVTVIHNGVLLHHRQPLLGGTAHRNLASYAAHGPTGPIKLQDHGNPMRFRNIWIRPLTAYDAQ